MLFGNTFAALVLFVTVFRSVVGDIPNFRVLAPEFVCPNDKEAVVEKPDNTVITIKTDAMNLRLSWSVRWTHLDGLSQRFTLLLWRTVRALETKLNAMQPEPFVYVIDNAEETAMPAGLIKTTHAPPTFGKFQLLQGVEYIFNVTASDPASKKDTTKSFSIDNIKGDPKLMIEGRSDKFSVLLIGGETVYADMEYVMEAEVTTCSSTQDYFFVWSVRSTLSSPLNTSETSGARLEITPYSLRAGSSYYVSCAVYRNSGEFVTQTGLPFQVLYRELGASLNFDVLVVTVNTGFDVRALVDNHDYYGIVPVFEWSCIYENEPCENFESIDDAILTLSNGLPYLGRYEIILTVTLEDQHASANASINVVEPTLPTIEIQSQSRTVNENSIVTLTANASSVAPHCTLTWYFANEEFLASLDSNDTCDDCQHGKALSDSVIIFSLEENFLSELSDFTNETEWRQVTALMTAAAGRARFVAQCGCSLTFSCDTLGVVYVDIHFELNEGPKVPDIKVSPATGTAMETIFRLSTLAASDPGKPLRYSFYCSLGTNDTLILGSYMEHLAVETFLPYVDATGTNIWVMVCDSFGACSSSGVKTVQLLAGEGRTVQALVDSMRGHINRCEILLLRRIVESAVTTYRNANQAQVLSMYSNTLLDILLTAEENNCLKNSQDYHQLLDWLIQAGVDLTSLYL